MWPKRRKSDLVVRPGAQYGMGPYTQKRAQKVPEAPAPTSVPIRIIRSRTPSAPQDPMWPRRKKSDLMIYQVLIVIIIIDLMIYPIIIVILIISIIIMIYKVFINASSSFLYSCVFCLAPFLFRTYLYYQNVFSHDLCMFSHLFDCLCMVSVVFKCFQL